jgi:hypothetical protein
MLVYCKACEGTGLYVGLAERKGAAVVCSSCDGTGAVEYNPPTPFKQRRFRDNVTSVSQANSGKVLEPGVDLGAISYEDFLAGKMPAAFQLAPEYAK